MASEGELRGNSQIHKWRVSKAYGDQGRYEDNPQFLNLVAVKGAG